mmetsp:Transcript_4097/g.8594  ORF Transcript_4097/g.8594 Transcript_4097/m.8594 type:complete len:101 (+) Transcript_4097:33-335(+)
MATISLISLNDRLNSLSSTYEHEAVSKAVKEVKKDILLKLRDVKASLVESGSLGGNTKVDSDLKEENSRLREENEKLRYRVTHLVKMLEEEEGKVRELTA